jgi:hypothetical protein
MTWDAMPSSGGAFAPTMIAEESYASSPSMRGNLLALSREGVSQEKVTCQRMMPGAVADVTACCRILLRYDFLQT